MGPASAGPIAVCRFASLETSAGDLGRDQPAECPLRAPAQVLDQVDPDLRCGGRLVVHRELTFRLLSWLDHEAADADPRELLRSLDVSRQAQCHAVGLVAIRRVDDDVEPPAELGRLRNQIPDRPLEDHRGRPTVGPGRDTNVRLEAADGGTDTRRGQFLRTERAGRTYGQDLLTGTVAAPPGYLDRELVGHHLVRFVGHEEPGIGQFTVIAEERVVEIEPGLVAYEGGGFGADVALDDSEGLVDHAALRQ